MFSLIYWSLGIFLLAIVLLFALLVNAGVFRKVVVTTGIPKLGKTYIAYKYHKGEYKNTSQAIKEIYSICPTAKCFGIFYDDPKIVSDFNF